MSKFSREPRSTNYCSLDYSVSTEFCGDLESRNTCTESTSKSTPTFSLSYEYLNTIHFNCLFVAHNVTGDGHCLIYSLEESFNQNYPTHYLSKETIVSKLSDYVFMNIEYFKTFFAYQDQNVLIDEMLQYTINKRYNTLFGDYVPYLLALANNITLKIYEKNAHQYRITIFNQQIALPDNCEQQTNCNNNATLEKRIVYVLKTGDHYQALIKREKTQITKNNDKTQDVLEIEMGNGSSLNETQQITQTSRDNENKNVKAVETHLASGNALNFSIIGQNVNGINGMFKRIKVFNYLLPKGDIILLQETHFTSNDESFFEKYGKAQFSHGTSNSRGVATFFKNSLEYNFIEEFKDEEGRLLIVKCKIQGQIFVISNVYAPNDEKSHAKFLIDFQVLLCKINMDDVSYFISQGDWNFTENLHLDREGGHPKVWKDSIAQITLLKESFDLIDIWRIRNEKVRKYTWSSPGRKLASRLDRFYISDALQNLISETSISNGISSDHKIVKIHIKASNFKKGCGQWRMNNSLLKNKQFTEELRGLIRDFQRDQPDVEIMSAQQKFDFLKFKVREFSITKSKQIAKEQRAEMIDLENKIRDLEKQANEDKQNEEIQTELFECQHKLEEHHNRITQGLILQSRCQFYELGEKNNKFFLNLIKRNQEKSTIRTLKHNNDLADNDSSIIEMLKDFYANLYSSKGNIDCNEWINTLKNLDLIPQLNEDEKNMLRSPITIEEIGIALSTFTPNKSPGNDGLAAEFYQFYWEDIKDMLFDSYQESIIKKEMSTSQKQSFIKLIDKKGKDKLLVKNWRPLNIINFDIKLWAKTLVLRMIPLLNKLIKSDQTAYIRGRFIGEGTKVIEGIIEYLKGRDEEGYLLAIDFEKAFDSLEWNFLWNALDAFGFPSEFIQLLKLLYNNVEACVINGGTTSSYFKLKRGVKQGDPPSGVLFILAMELLLIKMRSNKAIQGIEVNRLEIKLAAFADDLNNFLRNIDSVKETLRELETFGDISGLKCNSEKCELMALGNGKPIDIIHNNSKIEWVEETTITGIIINKNGLNTEENYLTVVDKVENHLKMWKPRGLSLLGKTQALKTYGISQILYTMNVVEPNLEWLSKLRNITFNFIWDSKIDKVKRATAIANFEDGGIKAPDIEIFLIVQRIIWVKRYIFSENHNWKIFFDLELDKIGGRDILQSSAISMPDIRKKVNLSPFYESIVNAWAIWKECNQNDDRSLDDFLYFNPKFLKPNGETIFYPQLVKKGIKFLRDIHEDGMLLTFDQMKSREILSNCDFLSYSSVYNIVKQSIEIENPMFVQKDDTIVLNYTVSKTLYSKIVQHRSQKPSSEVFFEDLFPNYRFNWKKIYSIPLMSTIESKMRALQIKINHNIFFTNEKLYLCTPPKIDSSKCTFCKDQIETLVHLFAECKCIQPLWNEIEEIFNTKFSIAERILGKVNDSNFFISQNHLILIMKYYLHVSRIKQKNPSVFAFRKRITYNEKMEYEIALRSNKIEKHIKKWDKINQKLD